MQSKPYVIRILSFALVVLIVGIPSILSAELSDDPIDQHDTSLDTEINRETLFTRPEGAQYFSDRSFIHIDNNWSTTTSFDWCSGDGSSENPYTIENVTIDVNGNSRGWGVKIENSIDDYFILRNVHVTNASAYSSDSGIIIHNSNNGYLDNLTTIDCVFGVNVSSSENIWVHGGVYQNSIWSFEETAGVLMLDSSNIEVSDINAEGFVVAIMGKSSDHLTGSNNNLKDSTIGLGFRFSSYVFFQSHIFENISIPYLFQLSSDSVVDGESFYNIENIAVYIFESDNITIRNNHSIPQSEWNRYFRLVRYRRSLPLLYLSGCKGNYRS